MNKKEFLNAMAACELNEWYMYADGKVTVPRQANSKEAFDKALKLIVQDAGIPSTYLGSEGVLTTNTNLLNL